MAGISTFCKTFNCGDKASSDTDEEDTVNEEKECEENQGETNKLWWSRSEVVQRVPGDSAERF